MLSHLMIKYKPIFSDISLFFQCFAFVSNEEGSFRVRYVSGQRTQASTLIPSCILYSSVKNDGDCEKLLVFI